MVHILHLGISELYLLAYPPTSLRSQLIKSNQSGESRHQYCWWFTNPAFHSPVEVERWVHVYPIIYRVLAPSQVVVSDFFHQQYLRILLLDSTSSNSPPVPPTQLLASEGTRLFLQIQNRSPSHLALRRRQDRKKTQSSLHFDAWISIKSIILDHIKP